MKLKTYLLKQKQKQRRERERKKERERERGGEGEGEGENILANYKIVGRRTRTEKNSYQPHNIYSGNLMT